jgi:hypothetical protein
MSSTFVRVLEVASGAVCALTLAIAVVRIRRGQRWESLVLATFFLFLFVIEAFLADVRNPVRVLAYFGSLVWTMSALILLAIRAQPARPKPDDDADPPFSRRRVLVVATVLFVQFVWAALFSLVCAGSISDAISFALLLDSGPAPLARAFLAFAYALALLALIGPRKERRKSAAVMRIELNEYAAELQARSKAKKPAR